MYLAICRANLRYSSAVTISIILAWVFPVLGVFKLSVLYVYISKESLYISYSCKLLQLDHNKLMINESRTDGSSVKGYNADQIHLKCIEGRN